MKKNSNIEAEAALAEELYKDRAALNHNAEEVLASGSRQVTIQSIDCDSQRADKGAKPAVC
ncbi:MAG TPA: hypothetical protein VHY84_11355 [Bryobacteraceae bacterium]|jgi:hypothetical protein|nr:hypothetical protein [Bryobacteraceae bacterium]